MASTQATHRQKTTAPHRPSARQANVLAGNIHYEMADRTRAVACGGIGAIHLLARIVKLAEAIDGGSVVIDASAGDGNEYVAGIVSSGTNVTYQNVNRAVIGQTSKPFFRNNTGDATAVKDGGGNVTMLLPSTLPPAKQPVTAPNH